MLLHPLIFRQFIEITGIFTADICNTLSPEEQIETKSTQVQENVFDFGVNCPFKG